MAERLPRASRVLVSQARSNRSEPTEAERILWERLRRRQVAGALFRRQHPMGRFIVDFFCDDARLVVEVDGGYHDEGDQAGRDQDRQSATEAAGFSVLRFANDEILRDTDRVVAAITQHVSTHRRAHPLPRSAGEGAGGGGAR